MSETLMTEADQTNEGSTQQPVEETQTEQSAETTTTETQQQAETVTDQQDSDESSVESETSEQETKKEGAPEKYEFNDKVADAPEVLDPDVLTGATLSNTFCAASCDRSSSLATSPNAVSTS